MSTLAATIITNKTALGNPVATEAPEVVCEAAEPDTVPLALPAVVVLAAAPEVVARLEVLAIGPPGMIVALEVMVLPTEFVLVTIIVGALVVFTEAGTVDEPDTKVSVGLRAPPTIDKKLSLEDLLMTTPPVSMESISVLTICGSPP